VPRLRLDYALAGLPYRGFGSSLTPGLASFGRCGNKQRGLAPLRVRNGESGGTGQECHDRENPVTHELFGLVLGLVPHVVVLFLLRFIEDCLGGIRHVVARADGPDAEVAQGQASWLAVQRQQGFL
jgi:hypothetical protein